VEIDCYSREFRRKVQLLAHFKKENIRDASKFKAMLQHTFKYRSGQLFEFLDTLTDPKFKPRLYEASRETSVNEDLIFF
jgi:hypothetical protein